MARVDAARQADPARRAGRSRDAWADNLKVVLVVGVIVAHVTIAWTGIGSWVFTEEPVREPLFSVLVLASSGSLFGLAVFFLLAGMYTPRSLARKGTRRFLLDRVLRLGLPLLGFVLLIAPVVEWADPDRAGWDRGFVAYTLEVVWWSWPQPPAWGPTWFLAVLLLFSVVSAAGRAVVPPARGRVPTTPVLVPAGRAGFGREAAIHDAKVLAVVPEWVRLNYMLGSEKATTGVPQGWYAGLPCPDQVTPPRDRSAVQCDEYPYCTTIEGGPRAYERTNSAPEGNPMLELILIAGNGAEGQALRSMVTACGMETATAVAPGTLTNPTVGAPAPSGKSEYLVVPLPGLSVSTFYVCGATSG